MELINRKSIEVRQQSAGKVSVRVDIDGFYISRQAVAMFQIRKGQFAHFVNDGADWKFIINDNTDGFLVASNGQVRNGLRICSRPLIRMFIKSIEHKKLPSTYFLHSTDIFIEGVRAIEIMTVKPANKIGE